MDKKLTIWKRAGLMVSARANAMAAWRPAVPAVRHWLSGRAFLGAAVTVYNVFLAIIQIAPITHADVKWWLFGVGIILSGGVWYSLAQANDAEERSRVADESRHAEVMDGVGEVKALVTEGAARDQGTFIVSHPAQASSQESRVSGRRADGRQPAERSL